MMKSSAFVRTCADTISKHIDLQILGYRDILLHRSCNVVGKKTTSIQSSITYLMQSSSVDREAG